MFGWLKKLFKHGNKLPGIVQLGLGILLILAIRWLYQNVIYQHFKTLYLESFGNPVKCTYYYMNGCPHCERMDPVWSSLKNNYNGNIKLEKKERGEAGADLDKYKIQGFPTVILVDQNGNHKEFEGERTESSLMNFLKG